MLRVLHVLPSISLDRGGPSRSVIGLAQAEARAGADVELVAARPHGVADVANPAGVKVYGGQHLPVSFAIPGPALGRALWKGVERADIVHLHTIWNGTVSLAEVMCRLRSVPYVLSPRGTLDAHNIERRRRLKRAAYHVLERGNLGRAAGWHFLDPTEREGCSWLPAVANASNVLVAPNGIDLERIQEAADRTHQTSFLADQTGGINLVFMGRIHPIKGLDLALDAVRTIVDTGVRCVLHLIGPDDGCLTNLLDQARALNIGECVRSWGAIYGDDRFSILRSADAVVMTSQYECNSVTAAETMAAGGLLIATETCHLDVASNAGAAVIVPRNCQALADTIMACVSDLGRSAGVRERARHFAMQCLAWPSLAERMLGLYHQVLGSPQCVG